ncbi:MAG: GNAT family N-acetyltransferase, partial [Alphaproteobacteria bacterium]|nr:GNAT family N-acetyltransferase [Alphaproteobacteria bacterium]
VEPLPLQADCAEIFRSHEVWIKPGDIDAALILETGRRDDILIWSVSTSPETRRRGLGHALLECADVRARQLGCRQIRLYTGQLLTHLVAWYSRKGYIVERLEELPDRKAVHMLKTLT